MKGPGMKMFGKSNGGGRRKSGRPQSPLLGTLSTVADDYRVGLVNLSSSGAQIRAPELPAQGEEVIFRADSVVSFGRVAWCRDGQCGVAFEPAMTGLEVERLRIQANLWRSAGWSVEETADVVKGELGAAD